MRDHLEGFEFEIVFDKKSTWLQAAGIRAQSGVPPDASNLASKRGGLPVFGRVLDMKRRMPLYPGAGTGGSYVLPGEIGSLSLCFFRPWAFFRSSSLRRRIFLSVNW